MHFKPCSKYNSHFQDKETKKKKAKEGENNKNDPNLLKPSDIPANVMEEKKNLINSKQKSGDKSDKSDSNKTENSEGTNKTPDENKPTDNKTTDAAKTPETPKSPSKSALKNPEPPKSPSKSAAPPAAPPKIEEPKILEEIKSKKQPDPISIMKSPKKTAKGKGKQGQGGIKIQRSKNKFIIPRNLLGMVSNKMSIVI